MANFITRKEEWVGAAIQNDILKVANEGYWNSDVAPIADCMIGYEYEWCGYPNMLFVTLNYDTVVLCVDDSDSLSIEECFQIDRNVLNSVKVVKNYLDRLCKQHGVKCIISAYSGYEGDDSWYNFPESGANSMFKSGFGDTCIYTGDDKRIEQKHFRICYELRGDDLCTLL